jgi:hypothetical protein
MSNVFSSGTAAALALSQTDMRPTLEFRKTGMVLVVGDLAYAVRDMNDVPAMMKKYAGQKPGLGS